MNSRRDYRSNRVTLFDGIEEGRIHASSSYTSHENDSALDGLHDRVNILKRAEMAAISLTEGLDLYLAGSKTSLISSKLTGDIHEEVESHNSVLDRMGNAMDASRGILSGTVDRFKIVFERKSSRRMATLIGSFLIVFLLIYYLTK